MNGRRLKGVDNILKIEDASKSEKKITKKSSKTDIPFTAYFMSFIAFMVPPISAFVSCFFVTDLGINPWVWICLPIMWAIFYRQFIIYMKEDSIEHDVFSRAMYIFLTIYMTYGIILTCVIKKVIDYGWF